MNNWLPTGKYYHVWPELAMHSNLNQVSITYTYTKVSKRYVDMNKKMFKKFKSNATSEIFVFFKDFLIGIFVAC